MSQKFSLDLRSVVVTHHTCHAAAHMADAPNYCVDVLGGEEPVPKVSGCTIQPHQAGPDA